MKLVVAILILIGLSSAYNSYVRDKEAKALVDSWTRSLKSFSQPKVLPEHWT